MRHRVMTLVPRTRPGNFEMHSFVRARQIRVGVTILLVCGMLASAAHAEVCGDADRNGSVTVTDGVQVLRAAAGLSSNCDGGRCDVNGDGSVTVTDGVQVLRAAAGLSANVDCGRDPIINSVTDDSGIFGALTKIPGGLVAPPGAPKTIQQVTFADSKQFVQGRVNTVKVEYDSGGAQAQAATASDLSLIVASSLDDANPSPRVFELPIKEAQNTLTVALNVRDDIPVTQFQLQIANGSGGQPIGQIEKILVVIIREIPPRCGNGVLDGNETCDPPGLRCTDASIPGFCSNPDCRCEPLNPGPTPTPIPGARFVDDGKTVTDTMTGLEWEKKTTAAGSGANSADPHDVDNTYSWCLDADQDFHCDNSGSPPDGSLFTQFLAALNTPPCFASHCDWRVPTVHEDGGSEELETIVDLNAPGCGSGGPCVAPIFGPTDINNYWSAITQAANPNGPLAAWCVYFGLGQVDGCLKSLLLPARAVRGVTCNNQTLDGDESDVDCGGTSCPGCPEGKACRSDTDCQIGCNPQVCVGGTCNLACG